ncbi:helix-turn-helix domain-containing protein [Streptomyces sp. TP-A0356]|uniref:helix-turn-helix domain-containing protein n=1 Tax=Streptomyces sp. TP-A0356 TaxID=1359208 RepID=UPI0006E2D9A6|nr:helix-turn-helix domain-containing protein [Streptomyces sp. TP-A0356]
MTQSPASPLPPPKELRRLREAESLTQAQVAAMVGASLETVLSWETGGTAPQGRHRETYARLLAGWAAKNAAPARKPQGELRSRHAPPLYARPAGTEGPVLPWRPGRATNFVTPHQAFDELYGICAAALVRQAYLLTGRRELARESVERAFQLAWQRWPEVARDRDPAGWVRAAAHDWALSPWHRFRPRHRHAEPPPAAPADRALMQALLKLPPVHRRTLVLYDGVGLGLPETAAETEASTPAAAARLLYAREVVAALVPEQAAPEVLHRRLAELASSEHLRAARALSVRTFGERRIRRWTRGALVLTAAITGATILTLRTAPDHYERPVARGTAIQDIPARAAQGPLSDRQLELQAKLRSESHAGPERLMPEAR